MPFFMAAQQQKVHDVQQHNLHLKSDNFVPMSVLSVKTPLGNTIIVICERLALDQSL